MSYLVLGAQLVLLGVFAPAAVGKFRSAAAYAGFVAAVGAFGVPRRLRGPAAAAVVAGEIAVVALLAVPWTRWVGFVLAAGLLTVFGLGVLRVLRRGERAPCRCFGASNTPAGRSHLMRNALLLAVAVVGMVGLHRGDVAIGVRPAAVALVVAASVVAVLLVRHLEDLVEILTPETR